MLFSPVTINKTEFKNRIIFPSMLTRFAASGGEMSDQLMNYHVARARGGVGLNMLEATCVHPSGICFEAGLSLYDDRYIRGLAKFASAIHAAGGKAGVQLLRPARAALPGQPGIKRMGKGGAIRHARPRFRPAGCRVAAGGDRACRHPRRSGSARRRGSAVRRAA